MTVIGALSKFHFKHVITRNVICMKFRNMQWVIKHGEVKWSLDLHHDVYVRPYFLLKLTSHLLVNTYVDSTVY